MTGRGLTGFQVLAGVGQSMADRRAAAKRLKDELDAQAEAAQDARDFQMGLYLRERKDREVDSERQFQAMMGLIAPESTTVPLPADLAGGSMVSPGFDLRPRTDSAMSGQIPSGPPAPGFGTAAPGQLRFDLGGAPPAPAPTAPRFPMGGQTPQPFPPPAPSATPTPGGKELSLPMPSVTVPGQGSALYRRLAAMNPQEAGQAMGLIEPLVAGQIQKDLAANPSLDAAMTDAAQFISERMSSWAHTDATNADVQSELTAHIAQVARGLGLKATDVNTLTDFALMRAGVQPQQWAGSEAEAAASHMAGTLATATSAHQFVLNMFQSGVSAPNIDRFEIDVQKTPGWYDGRAQEIIDEWKANQMALAPPSRSGGGGRRGGGGASTGRAGAPAGFDDWYTMNIQYIPFTDSYGTQKYASQTDRDRYARSIYLTMVGLVSRWKNGEDIESDPEFTALPEAFQNQVAAAAAASDEGTPKE